MPSLSFPPPPDGLGPEQRQRWALRRRTVEDALAGLTADGTAPDAAAAGHLRDYVNGRITLVQALGRIVDLRARAAGPRPHRWGCGNGFRVNARCSPVKTRAGGLRFRPPAAAGPAV